MTITLQETDYPYQSLPLGDAKVLVLYEDNQLIVVNKPAGIKTHPNEAGETNTMANHLAAYLEPKDQRPPGSSTGWKPLAPYYLPKHVLFVS